MVGFVNVTFGAVASRQIVVVPEIVADGVGRTVTVTVKLLPEHDPVGDKGVTV